MAKNKVRAIIRRTATKDESYFNEIPGHLVIFGSRHYNIALSLGRDQQKNTFKEHKLFIKILKIVLCIKQTLVVDWRFCLFMLMGSCLFMTCVFIFYLISARKHRISYFAIRTQILHFKILGKIFNFFNPQRIKKSMAIVFSYKGEVVQISVSTGRPGTKKFSCPGVPLSRDKGRSKNPGTNSSVPGQNEYIFI